MEALQQFRRLCRLEDAAADDEAGCATGDIGLDIPERVGDLVLRRAAADEDRPIDRAGCESASILL